MKAYWHQSLFVYVWDVVMSVSYAQMVNKICAQTTVGI